MGGLSICGLVTGACHRPVLNVTFCSLNLYACLLLPLQAAALSTERTFVPSSSADDTVRTFSSVKIAISSQVLVPDWRGSLTLSGVDGRMLYLGGGDAHGPGSNPFVPRTDQVTSVSFSSPPLGLRSLSSALFTYLDLFAFTLSLKPCLPTILKSSSYALGYFPSFSFACYANVFTHSLPYDLTQC